MKAIFISYNQAHTEKVEFLLDRLEIRGFTQWVDVKGRGSETGDPHMGTHTWPEINGAILSIVEDDQVELVLEKIKKIDEINTSVGIRAFVWSIEKTI